MIDHIKSAVTVGLILLIAVAPVRAQENAKPEITVLAFSGTGWYRHAEIPDINAWLVSLGAEHEIDIHITETPGDINPKRLEKYDVVLFQNANWLGEVFNEQQRAVLQQWYENGGAFVGIHAASVQVDTWPWYTDVIGCNFTSDSEFERARVTIPAEGQGHPIVDGFPEEFWYEADYQNYDRSVQGLEGVTVLLTVDDNTYTPVRDDWKRQGAEPMPEDHPIIWTREYKGGRYFYTGLGHDVRALDTDFGRSHVVEGIRWAAGRQ